MSVLGLDIGTTGTKAVVFAEDGKLLSSAYEEYPLLFPRPGWAELDSAGVWAAVQRVVAKAASGSRDKVKALSVSVFGESFMPVGRNAEPLYNTILSFDARAEAQTQRLTEKLGRREIFQLTGMPQHSSYTVNKIMWLRDNEPDVFRKTWKFLLWEDFFFLKLGLEPKIDHSLVGRTLALDVRTRGWAQPVLDAAGIEPSAFATPCPSGEIVGEVSRKAAKALGLPAGAKVVAGAHDQPACALGAGVVDPGVSTDTTGTVECMTIAMAEPVLTDAMLAANHGVYPHCAPGRYVSLAFLYTAGSILRWFRDKFGADALREAKRRKKDVYEVLISKAPEGPIDLFLLPHFAGTGTPYLDSNSRGVLAGLTLNTTPADITRAILDGVAYEMRINLESVRSGGLKVEKFNAIGGGSRSDRWCQAKADITGLPVDALDVSEAGCLGVAMLAGVAVGVWPSLDAAIKQLVRVRKSFAPDPAGQKLYNRAFGVYRRIYRSCSDLNHAIAAFASELHETRRA
ncbi:MAG TPA: FGGY-family carbohydrate kinase [Planctomycetota bacterium]|nr:FGGY-family carbohydrate kinase [Planctomycetota bacterium]